MLTNKGNFMQLNFNKPLFSGLKTCELAGIERGQIQSLKKVGLIQNKFRYSVQEIIYIAFANQLRQMGYSWKTISGFYDDKNNYFNLIANTDILCYSVIIMAVDDKTGQFKTILIPRKNRSREDDNYMKWIESLKNLTDTIATEVNEMRIEPKENTQKPSWWCRVNDTRINIFYISRVVEEIIQNSRALNTRINVEKEILFALESSNLIGR